MCLLCVAQGGAVQHKCDLSGVQKGQIAHLGRQKPPESELAVAAHGGASQRHTTGAVYGRLRTSWDGDGPCGLNLSVGGHTVQNKQTKQNNYYYYKHTTNILRAQAGVPAGRDLAPDPGGGGLTVHVRALPVRLGK